LEDTDRKRLYSRVSTDTTHTHTHRETEREIEGNRGEVQLLSVWAHFGSRYRKVDGRIWSFVRLKNLHLLVVYKRKKKKTILGPVRQTAVELGARGR
jgi:hypothetical protein